ACIAACGGGEEGRLRLIVPPQRQQQREADAAGQKRRENAQATHSHRLQSGLCDCGLDSKVFLISLSAQTERQEQVRRRKCVQGSAGSGTVEKRRRSSIGWSRGECWRPMSREIRRSSRQSRRRWMR